MNSVRSPAFFSADVADDLIYRNLRESTSPRAQEIRAHCESCGSASHSTQTTISWLRCRAGFTLDIGRCTSRSRSWIVDTRLSLRSLGQTSASPWTGIVYGSRPLLRPQEQRKTPSKFPGSFSGKCNRCRRADDSALRIGNLGKGTFANARDGLRAVTSTPMTA